ncbi:virulence factor [Halomonas sp. CH40]
MASMILVSWRDIPAQIIVKQGRRTAKVMLSERFQHAIDRSAMRAGKGGSDAYMEDWKRSAPTPCGDDMQAEAESAAARLEAAYSDEDLKQLIRQKGVADATDAV